MTGFISNGSPKGPGAEICEHHNYFRPSSPSGKPEAHLTSAGVRCAHKVATTLKTARLHGLRTLNCDSLTKPSMRRLR